MINNNHAVRSEAQIDTAEPNISYLPVQRRVQHEPAPLMAVSPSSYLNEKDRHFRGGETIENGADLAMRAAVRVLDLDSRLRAAQADGASPRAMAIIERIEEAYGQTAGMLVFDFMGNPYERW